MSPELLLWLTAAVSLLNLFLMVVTFARRPLNSSDIQNVLFAALRAETDTIIKSIQDQARVQREELSSRVLELRQSVISSIQSLSGSLIETLRTFSEQSHVAWQQMQNSLHANAASADEQAKALREEVNRNIHHLSGNLTQTLTEMNERQKERLDKANEAISALTKSVETKLDAIRTENAVKLDEMRKTVDEKLHNTLETRLGESFNKVVEQLNRVHEGLGEMKLLAANVGDLKSVLTNVKVRGTFGEVQLELLLEQFLSPEQYIKDAQVRANSGERVEFAIRFPGREEGGEVLLPIDAKFPREVYDRLQEASERGEEEAVRTLRKQLEAQIRNSAKTICQKYIAPPTTTDFAILFLPTEGLYAEVLRQVGLVEALQRDFKITLAGPTTLCALLNALQMGFRSLAIEKRSGEVWRILGAVQGEFTKYNDVVEKLGNQLSTAANSVDKLARRTRAMSRTLKNVEATPEGPQTAALLGIDQSDLSKPIIVSSSLE